MRRIHVMAAVIRRPDGRILIAKRPEHAHQGGLWEFPGGKLEPGETRQQALGRELYEELGIRVTQARPLIDIRHDYPDKSVRLDVWQVDGFDGEPRGAEGQPIRWVAPHELIGYAFPAANISIVTAARLPDRYLITPDEPDRDRLFSGLEKAIEAGALLIQLRQAHLTAADYASLVREVLDRFGSQCQWLIKGQEPPTRDGVGWHLTSAQLRNLSTAGWQRGEGPPHGWLAASCHDETEIELAEQLGVDFITLSPVRPTPSHPEAAGLGWSRVTELLSTTNLPAYVLGGLSEQELPQAFEAGAQGVAGIRGFWPV